MRDQRNTSERSGPDSRQVIEALKEPVIKLFHSIVFVSTLFWIERKEQQVFLIETKLYMLEIVKSAYE